MRRSQDVGQAEQRGDAVDDAFLLGKLAPGCAAAAGRR